VLVEEKVSFIDKKTFHTGTTIAGAIFKVSYTFAMFPMITQSLTSALYKSFTYLLTY